MSSGQLIDVAKKVRRFDSVIGCDCSSNVWFRRPRRLQAPAVYAALMTDGGQRRDRA
jgi:hypothetical protein